MAFQLVKPAAAYEVSYQSFRKEWKSPYEEYAPSFIRKELGDVQEFVQRCADAEKGIGLPEGWVPYSTFWLLKNKRIIGAAVLRHGLNERLVNTEGHISLGIRPSERGNGYGRVILSLALAELRKLGIERALVVCEEGNIPSERMIIRLGGERDVDFKERDGTVLRRYWISI
ncbi:GNAT family N-acetyltransferase [Sporosarcina cyprini]|uniref:GNAT family N-acetyltransferase n=1 Tax=Sporosarcina cyprini TaxID=2910523 RepID=UPI001EE1380E|nr:GNAT family N-acetyltransferase [Sporosarcina cyprini]MCG3089353.1 GNAT family N-acetyltransferase [Sporosarcina cyprini]